MQLLPVVQSRGMPKICFDAEPQVYKAVRGCVQDVAIKIMHEADDEQLAQFEKVTQ